VASGGGSKKKSGMTRTATIPRPMPRGTPSRGRQEDGTHLERGVERGVESELTGLHAD
jgi:hypothetical protein